MTATPLVQAGVIETQPDATKPDAMPPALEPATPANASGSVAGHDTFDSFDAAWAGMEPATQADIESLAIPSPFDESSLGSALDAPEVWAHEITSAAEAIAKAGEEAAEATPAAESKGATPAFGMPAWLADDTQPVPDSAKPLERPSSMEQGSGEAPGTWAPIEADASYSASDWSDLAALPPAEEIVASVTESSLDEASLGSPASEPWTVAAAEVEPPLASRFELVEEPAASPGSDTPDPRTLHGLRVSATLERLAERIRAGEIDVSFVAPEANDVAVLASVLAALLGGSSSR